MLKNYFKIAVRLLKKRKGFAIINIISLALGLSGGIFMLVFALDEFSFDKFHKNGERIFRVNTIFIDLKTGREGYNYTNGWPIGKILKEEFPEVEEVVYTIDWPKLDIKVGEENLNPRMAYVSPEFFEVFSFEQVKGLPYEALSKPYHAVITEDMEMRMFKGKDGLGKEFFLADTIPAIVGAVVKNAPKNSHIQFEVLLSQATFEKLNGLDDYMKGWSNISMGNYVMLKEGVDLELFKQKAEMIYMDHVGEMMRSWGSEAKLFFEPLTDVYLKSKSGNGLGSLGSLDRLNMVFGICIFTILLACINFINLTTARSVDRFKEIGLRKVVGSSKGSLMGQFITESFVLTLIGLFFSILLISLLLPTFNDLVNKAYTLDILLKPNIIIAMIMLVVVITLLSGYYPSLYLASLQPLKVLKGKSGKESAGMNLRKVLVVFQFFISVSLALGTIIVLRQLDFMQQKELGFAKEEILVINALKIPKNNIESLKNELINIPGINKVSYSNGLPGRPGWIGQIAYLEGNDKDNPVSLEYLSVDQDYLETMDLQLVAGRFFDQERESDKTESLVLNEKAVQQFGWDNPEEAIGKKIVSPSTTPQGTVIGVVKDYHQLGLQNAIHGIAMDWEPKFSGWLSLRFEPSKTEGILNDLQHKWLNDFSGRNLDYFFLNDDFERLYQNELRVSKMLRLFSGLTFLISLIGLTGLVSFLIETKAKEMSIRKVLGAGVNQIVFALSKEFMILVCLASVIAIPAVWYFGKNWLNNFAYRTEISLSSILGVVVIAIVITMLLVGFQALRAASMNTMNGLKSE
ncbi:ABC transporter permease [Cecembia rubra]|uniref:ABC transporter permease n=1 Tax=Cecembia rubra TaxID=1485585 RepID=UPI00271485F3|nr:ABC transporter permease [Cecembia rubra]